jgi:hypothetical protein
LRAQVAYPSIYLNAGYDAAAQRTFVARVVAETVRGAAAEGAETGLWIGLAASSWG